MKTFETKDLNNNSTTTFPPTGIICVGDIIKYSDDTERTLTIRDIFLSTMDLTAYFIVTDETGRDISITVNELREICNKIRKDPK